MYKVIDAFKINDIVIMVLDRSMEADLDKSYISVGGKIMKYGWSHDTHLITVYREGNERDLIGKEIQFIQI